MGDEGRTGRRGVATDAVADDDVYELPLVLVSLVLVVVSVAVVATLSVSALLSAF